MKQIKLLIIMLSIFAAGIIVVMIIISSIHKNNRENNIINTNAIGNINNTNVNDADPYFDAPALTFNPSLQEVTEKSILYYLSNALNQYFNYIKEENMQAISELGGNNLYNIQNNVKYVVKEAYCTRNEYMAKYYTYGTLTTANGDFTSTEQEIYMVINLTSENSGYMVQTISEEEYKNRQALGENDTIDITQGTYNTYAYEHVSDVKQMEIYLEDYVFRVLNDTEKSYALLNEEYRNLRFGNINEYVNYLNEKIDQLENIKIIQYNVDESGRNKVYTGTDENGNYYQIEEFGYMEYELILDEYTMEDYSNASTEEKIKQSAQKFILMVNSADYTNAYNLLDETFKTENFPTQQDFVNYVKNNWYARNIIASREVKDDGICIVKIKETLSTQSNTMEKQFKITLGSGMNFTIEFDV